MPTLVDLAASHESLRPSLGPIAAAKIMIVDDDPTATDLVCAHLGALGFEELCTCTDSEQAFQRLDDWGPDLLLLDILMPGVGGLDILRDLRASKSWAHLPVIILTAMEDLETRIRALELGATDFLNKPMNFVELACRIRNALLVHEYQARLKHQAEELQHQVDLQTASLKESYAALECTNALLRRSCEAAEAATRAKSQFLATISHEIRTPLTAILGFTEELVSSDTQPTAAGDALEMLQTVHRNAEHLLTIVNDVLDVAKIEKGKLTVDCVPCSPIAIFAATVQLMQQQARAKGLEFVARTFGPIPDMVLTDPTRLQQILINLVGNAVKFTEQGLVRLAMRLRHERSGRPVLQFTVTDTGTGIPESQLDEIFQPFVQARTATVAVCGGTGLGLTISKYLVEALGGSIRVKSRAGWGSTFRITVAADAVGQTTNGACPAHILPPGDIAGCRVLLAEDCADSRRLIRLVLEKAGARVFPVENGQMAYDAVLEHRCQGESFDIILTDIQMPVLDGYELARRLRSSGYAGPIICLTANVLQGERERCLAAGCNAYVSKPIDRAELMSMMGRLYRR